MDKDYLILKRASASRPSAECDVLPTALLSTACSSYTRRRSERRRGGPLAFGHHEDRMPIHGYEATREAAPLGLVIHTASGQETQRKKK
jgi:hypothetical protein